ncbi:spore coat associated protein CotJA [Heliobacterium gestii]|uniref:Spore coat associated protein CotJA n=1 Tax=Heliomicrobium gestii TaxID=2699 RepID=A0A845LC72_HELGE|nr:spore coat associated protein CotJA [Heliomicrobium gestii]MBM7868223.1 hypothetical protein [Heliomicrobium gestii]MZP44417.1 spore coat associated protein CotJA [Heliomicrobium gestii]
MPMPCEPMPVPMPVEPIAREPMDHRPAPCAPCESYDPATTVPPEMMKPGWKLARAYVPYQQYCPPFYPPAEALCKGTIFPGLYRPYCHDRRRR